MAERGCSPETMWRRSKAPPLQMGRSRSEVTIAFNTSADNKQEAEHRVTGDSGLKVSSQTLRLIDLCAIQTQSDYLTSALAWRATTVEKQKHVVLLKNGK